MTPQSAMVFAAGFGTRMGELTRTAPKPMLPLSGRPMIDTTIDLARQAGIKNLVANTHHLHDVLEPHLAARDVTVSHEPNILETGGGLKAALPLLQSDPVLTINPDAAWFGPNPVSKLLDNWQDDMTALLLCVSSKTDGDFDITNGQIRRGGPYRYTGAQILRVDRLSEIDQDAFSLNLYWDMLMREVPLHGLVYDGDWIDIGTPEGLKRANQKFSS